MSRGFTSGEVHVTAPFHVGAAAVLASLLATIVTPANVIGLPVGIWALVVLFSERVRAAFRAASPKWNKPQPQTTPLAR